MFLCAARTSQPAVYGCHRRPLYEGAGKMFTPPQWKVSKTLENHDLHCQLTANDISSTSQNTYQDFMNMHAQQTRMFASLSCFGIAWKCLVRSIDACLCMIKFGQFAAF